MTSHPQDATEELFQVIARNPKIGRRFHLPLQSGSDRVLKRMKRLHTYAEYKAKIADREIFLKGETVKAADKGDAVAYEQLQAELVRERKTLQAELEQKKEAVREGK